MRAGSEAQAPWLMRFNCYCALSLAPHMPQVFSQIVRKGSLTNKIYTHTQYYSLKYARFVA